MLLMAISSHVFGSVYALYDTLETKTRIASHVTTIYQPVYAIEVNAESGDILRVSSQVEASEKEHIKNIVWGYLSIRSQSSSNRTRISSYGWQVANRKNNHHMPMNLYGHKVITSSDTYIIEIMARKSFASEVKVEWTGNSTSDYGQIIVEQYRQYNTPETAVNYGAKLLVDFDRAPMQSPTLVVGVNQNGIDFELPKTKTFSASLGDQFRIHGLATAQYLTDLDLFGLKLYSKINGGQLRRLSLSTENVFQWLYRFSLNNDGVHESNSVQNIHFYQTANGINNNGFVIPNGQTDLLAFQFSSNPIHLVGGNDAFYLHSSRKFTTTKDLSYSSAAGKIVLFDYKNAYTAGDIIRAQGQLQLTVSSVNSVASCWARIEVYRGSKRVYASVIDQRYLRNSNNEEIDHDSGTFSPFAVYKVPASNSYAVRLVADCGSAGGATLFAKDYGRHLTVDRFTQN